MAPNIMSIMPNILSLTSSFKINLARKAVTKTDNNDAGSATVTSNAAIAIKSITYAHPFDTPASITVLRSFFKASKPSLYLLVKTAIIRKNIPAKKSIEKA